MSSSFAVSNGEQVLSYTKNLSPGSREQSSFMSNFISDVPEPTISVSSVHFYNACSSGQDENTLLPHTGYPRLVPVQPPPSQLEQTSEPHVAVAMAAALVGASNVGSSQPSIRTQNCCDASSFLLGKEEEYFSRIEDSPTTSEVRTPISVFSSVSPVVWSSSPPPKAAAAAAVTTRPASSRGEHWLDVRSLTPASLDDNSSPGGSDVLPSPCMLGIQDQFEYETTRCCSSIFGTLSCPPPSPHSGCSVSATTDPLHHIPPGSSSSNNDDSCCSPMLGATTATAYEANMRASEPPPPIGDRRSDHLSSSSDPPYAQLIYQALMSRDDHCMSLQEIYQWFRDNTNKPDGRGKGWQNSIRHNLSMNRGFIKFDLKHAEASPSPMYLPTLLNTRSEKSKRSTIWTLQDWAITHGIQSTTRYRDARRRSDRSEARRRSRVSRRSASVFIPQGVGVGGENHPPPPPPLPPHTSTSAALQLAMARGGGTNSFMGGGEARHYAQGMRLPSYVPGESPTDGGSPMRSPLRGFFQAQYLPQAMRSHATATPVMSTAATTTTPVSQPYGLLVSAATMLQPRQPSSNSHNNNNGCPAPLPLPPVDNHQMITGSTGGTDNRQSSSPMFLSPQYSGPFPYRTSDVQLSYPAGVRTTHGQQQRRASPDHYPGEIPDGLYGWPENQRY